MRLQTLCGCVIVLAAFVAAIADDEVPLSKKTWVTPQPVAGVTVSTGKPAKVEMKFRVADGYHINSNKPGSELLIATALKFDVPTDIGIGKVTYPPGKDLTLSIAPDQPLNVYTGEFVITALVSATRTATPGNYKVHGGLKYQACNDRACFPPREAPVEFDVKVTRASASSRPVHNPPQSPHVHR
jgi:Thiol:disulfide interchange protein DsbD, N-terminal